MANDPKEVKSAILQAIRQHLDSLELQGQGDLDSDLYTKNTPIALEQAAARTQLRGGSGLDSDL